MAIGHPPGLPRWHRYPGAPVSAFVENTGPAIAVQTPWRRGAVIGANDVCSAAKGRLGLAPFPSSTVLDSFLTSTDNLIYACPPGAHHRVRFRPLAYERYRDYGIVSQRSVKFDVRCCTLILTSLFLMLTDRKDVLEAPIVAVDYAKPEFASTGLITSMQHLKRWPN